MPTKIIQNPSVECANAEFVVCYRCHDLPQPYVPARKVCCGDCKRKVWLADNSPQDRPIKCMECAKIAIAKDGEEPMIYMTERQALDLDFTGRRLQELLDAAVTALRPRNKMQ